MGIADPPALPPARRKLRARDYLALAGFFAVVGLDQYNLSEVQLRARLAGALGGRAAELLVFGSATTGAQNDLEMATALARRMVTTWGMSPKVGLIAYDDSRQAVFLGRELAGMTPVSQETAALVDEEIRRILEEEMDRARGVLGSNRRNLDVLVEALLEHEVLDEDALVAILGGRPDADLAQAS